MLEIFALLTFLAISSVVVGTVVLVMLLVRGVFKLLGAPISFILMLVFGVPLLIIAGVVLFMGLPVIGIVGVAIAIPLMCMTALVLGTCSLIFGFC